MIGVVTFSSVCEQVVDVAAESEVVAADECLEKQVQARPAVTPLRAEPEY